MSFQSDSLSTFIEKLASGSPTRAAAARRPPRVVAAGLVSMVCNLTFGKKRYAEFEERLHGYQQQAEQLSKDLLRLIDEDAEVYGAVMACYKMPKETEDEQAARKARIQETMKEATEVPLQNCRTCAQVLISASPPRSTPPSPPSATSPWRPTSPRRPSRARACTSRST